MSIPTWARLPRFALATAAALSILAACDDLTGPGEDLGSVPRMRPAPLVSPALVPITPSGLSTTDIPVLVLPELINGGIFTSNMRAINESNWVVGTAGQGSDKSVLWRGGDFELIWGASEPRTNRGFGLNDQGIVVGEWISSTGPAIAYRWADGAPPVLLPDPPVLATGVDSEARDADENGDIVVFYGRNTSTSCPEGSNVTGATAFLSPPYASSANYTVLEPAVCQTHVNGQAIDAGRVVGRLTTSGGGVNEAFVWDGNSGFQTLGNWFPTDIEGAYASGRRFESGLSMALRSELPAAPQDLGTLGGTASDALGVNGRGWVVGTSTTAGGQTHAFLWTPEDGMVDLGTLGGTFSRATDVNDAGYIVGDADNAAGQRLAVIWHYAPNQPPVIETIISQVVTVGETLEVTPVVTDPEGDPFTLSWTGDIAENVETNGTFTWTPGEDQVGDYEVTVTATQDDDPTLFDSELFVISVLAADPPASADLQVEVAPTTPQQQFLGDVVAYEASVHNAGPDAATANLTVALQYRDQAEWGAFPPEGAINGVFFIELGELAAGQTVDVPFEVVYGAFGVQGVTATAAADVDDLAPDDNVAVFEQVIDLPLDAPGVIATGLDVGGGSTFDGEPLAVVGLHVPAALVAGSPGDLFVPAALTPEGTLIPQLDSWDPALSFIPEPDQWEPRDVFIPQPDDWLPGQLVIPLPDEWLAGQVFIPSPDEWLPGQVFIPSPDQWAPAGRLLFARGATDLLVGERAGAGIGIEAGVGPGLAVDVAGGDADASLRFCAAGFNALMGNADGAEFACGSLTVEVFSGPVVIVLDDGTTVEVPAGTTVSITEGDEGWQVEVIEGDPSGVIVTPPVTNGEPVAAPGGPYVAAVGQTLTLDGSDSTDPDGDPLTYEWVLDDGSVSGITATGVSPTIVVPLVPDLYLLALTVTDPDGATSTSTVEVAVYDPERSSVTGGGWFHSPAGALVANPAAEGKANFAFHVAYRKGRSTPDGHARLAFQAGNLRLDSELFDWLVVGGEMARFRGIGDLEGQVAPVSFEVVARDPDRIHVRIWDGGGDIYDSGEVYIDTGRVVIQN